MIRHGSFVLWFRLRVGMMCDQDTKLMLGDRTVFNGINSKEMFSSETVQLPELSYGEILVKVIQSYLFE